jgi:Domain of unknown function (DUF5076)
MKLLRSKNELSIPPNARSDANAKELIRAWAAHAGLHCSLSVDNCGENERLGWGILLTDVARHVANALHEQKGWDKDETIREIRRVFNAELDSPTAEPSGEFLTH